ncbi:acyl-CoA/acyl-ACP dehydrogenase [Spongiibacter nanhainus]|uniref:Acyl-CoA/acyl-ACP dehydrogenase n=1 Tax=Spongiibacter nanhainus TaxID=2794344 RepID=A0A7T4QYX4_9GAMM|nr:acyl-CoA dehydrogenase family protein [Spongiibacter nanhainus]QQD17350.1 acyl-CoA/acyl-ACP dehydrogenase [Spongiibacter nanhainus]
MNFDFSDDQRMLADHARKFLSESCDPEGLRRHVDSGTDYDEALWQQMVELGWPAIAIPEEQGGLGMGALELCVLAEEVGRVLAPTPFFSTVCLAAEILKRCNNDEAAELLAQIALGEAIVAVDLLSTELQMNDRSTVSGSLPAVASARSASHLIAPAKCAGNTVLVMLDTMSEGYQASPLPDGIDELASYQRVALESVPVTLLESEQSAANLLETIINQAAVLTAFEQIGGAEVACYMARDYVLERYAFGRPVGGYQAVKHRLADMMIKIELARSNAYFGAWAMSAGGPELPLAAAVARVSATEAYNFAAEENLHLHGGIGYTWEANCHFFYKRARLLAMNLGNIAHWSKKLLAAA